MFGVLVNTAAVIVGAAFGLIFKKGIPQKISDALMKGLGLCVIYIGIKGTLDGSLTLVMIISMVIGGIIGTAVDIDGKLKKLAEKIERRFKKDGEESRFADGLVTATLMFCVGAMAVVGSLQAGMSNDNSTLFTKSIIDMTSAAIFASTMGIGVMFSAVPLFIYQGAIALAAVAIAPFLSDAVIAEINCSGSLLILALGINMLGLTKEKIKVANYLPAVILPAVITPLYNWIASVVA
jgi:hypothetical protein